MVKLHVLLTGLVIVPMILAGFLLFFEGGVSVYAPTDYNDSILQNMSGQLSNIESTVNNTAESVKDLQSNNPLDLLGALFNSAYSAVIITYNSLTIGLSLLVQSVTSLPVGDFGNTLITGLTSILMIVLFIAIGIHIITKSDRT